MAVFIGGIGSATNDYFAYSRKKYDGKEVGELRVFYSRQMRMWKVSFKDEVGDEIIDYFNSKSEIEDYFNVKLKKA